MTGDPSADYDEDPYDPYDDWYDDEPDDCCDGGPMCPPCGDSGYVGRRNCAHCNPTRWQRLAWIWRYRLRRLATPVRWCWRRLRHPGADPEPPF